MVVNAVGMQFKALNQKLNQALSYNQLQPLPLAHDHDISIRGGDDKTLNNTGYPIRCHGNGIFSRLPADYEFPQAEVYDCWIKWNIGDSVRGIPPLRILHAKDFAFMDSRLNKKCCATRNTFADLKFLCNFIEEEAKLNGMDPSNRSVANVGLVYERVKKSLFKGEVVDSKLSTNG
jgi:hypothetical protein